jgi:predicted MFS family arabinose efflux permease
MRIVQAGAVPIGALLGGALGDAFGLRAALLVAGLGVLLAPLVVFFSPVRRASAP